MSLFHEPFSKYLTHSQRDLQWQVYCTCVGCSETQAGAAYPPYPQKHPPQYVGIWNRGRVLNEFQLVYITKGRGLFKTKHRVERSVDSGNMIILFPGVWHWYKPNLQKGWFEYWVGFNGDYPLKLVKNGFLSSEKTIYDVGLHDSLVKDYLEIFELARREPRGYQQQLGAHVLQLLARVLSFSMQKKQNSNAEKIIQKAKFIIEENVYESIDLKPLSQDLGIGYTNFRRMFKEHTGLSPYQYFLQLKINKAKVFLSQGELSIKEIAYKLSFDNPYYFSRLFKKKTGIAPSDWNRSAFPGDVE